MRIHVVGTQDSNAPWAFELRIIEELQRLGHEIISTDFRQQRRDLPEILAHTQADDTLVFKGEWIPAQAIERVPNPVTLWYAEYLGSLTDIDYLAFRNRAVLHRNCRAFDRVLIHDPVSIPLCEQLGARKVSWLSCVMIDTEQFIKLNAPKEFDVLFVGAPTPRRRQIIDELSTHFKVTWPSIWKPEELNSAHNRARIVLNIHSSSVLNIETRLGEVLGAGAFLLSEKLSYPEMFQDGRHLVYWRPGDVSDLIDKTAYYLSHQHERENIAEAGYQFARGNHSTKVRVQELLGLMEGRPENLPHLDLAWPGFSMRQRIKYFITDFRARAWGIRERKRLGL